MKWINRLLNGITMYRLVLYYLIFLLAMGILFCFMGLLPYDPFTLLFTIGFLIAVCGLTNTIFSWAFRVPANAESVYISALILALILDPAGPSHDLIAIGWAGVLAMASKYMIAPNKKHIFNPVALSVVITALVLDQTASWWVGSAPMLPFVLLGGVLLVLKIRRGGMVLSFLVTSGLTILVFTLLNGSNLFSTAQNTVLSSPWLFFAFIFVTEPLTTPPTRKLQLIYGSLVGFLFAPQIHIGAFYFTPELAIVIGNVYSYLVSPKTKLVLTLREKIRLAPDIYDFIFVPGQRFAFAPGQYMEWTLPHENPDTRGNRRYFTLASSPTERDLRVGVKFYRNSSSYKHSMLDMDANTTIIAGQVAGDFVLPQDRRQKCVFIAGGIGITPFRSMIQYMLDKRQRRPVVLFYANKSYGEIVYQDVLEEAQHEIGIKVVYSVTDTYKLPPNWSGKIGRIDRQLIQNEVPDYKDCIFYISGPNEMVTACKDMLKRMHVPGSQIKTDFFPGLT
jgi:ferredoxin-NADP reductase